MASGFSTTRRLALILGGALALSGCDEAELPGFLAPGGGTSTAANTSSRAVERDVEAPEVFQVTDSGLWDGRPSLGGVWVAHPDVEDPERVIIRNEANSKFVIGVVYRPERAAPGPKFQVSSDAADALGMLAGEPATLNVTALRHEEEPEETPAAETPSEEAVPATELAGELAGELAAAPAVEASALDPIAAASEALDEAEAGPTMSVAAIAAPGAPAAELAAEPAAAPTSAPMSAPMSAPKSALDKPFIQIGIFSVEGNANNTAEALRGAGMVPTVKPGKISGKAFWRVIVGPATDAAERSTLLDQIKGLGFNDAYFVSN